MILTNAELRRQVSFTAPKRNAHREADAQRIENINSFNGLSRVGLTFDVLEKRILLYETQAGEKVYMQYPGKESARDTRTFPSDARPILIKADGTVVPDMIFKVIWDVIDEMGHDHAADIDILAAVFARVAFMKDYQHNDGQYLIETIDIPTNTVVASVQENFVWNSISLSADVWETINDKFRLTSGISMEAFVYYNDLLAQNEDCKYKYMAESNGKVWDYRAGRVNNILSHLTVIAHVRGRMGISALIDAFQRLGVAPLPISKFDDACNGLVRFRTDTEETE